MPATRPTWASETSSKWRAMKMRKPKRRPKPPGGSDDAATAVACRFWHRPFSRNRGAGGGPPFFCRGVRRQGTGDAEGNRHTDGLGEPSLVDSSRGEEP